MHGEDDEVTVEVNGERLSVDPDATRTIRFQPPKLSKERPPPEPPQWWEPGTDDDRQVGHFAAGDPPERPGGKGRPTVGPPPGPIQPPPGLNAFQTPPNLLGRPSWEPAMPDVPVFPPPPTGPPTQNADPVFPPPPTGPGTPVFPPPQSGGPDVPVFPPPQSGEPEAAASETVSFPQAHQAKPTAAPQAGPSEPPAFPPPGHAGAQTPGHAGAQSSGRTGAQSSGGTGAQSSGRAGARPQGRTGAQTPGDTGPQPPSATPRTAGADHGVPVAGTTAESLRPDRLLRTRRRPPAGGWRKAVFTLSGGLIRLGDSKAERRRQELIERIRQPVTAGHFRVAVMSLKGGVGKTTTTIGLGSTLAHNRGDRVIAVDANPDRGTLSEKLRMESPATVRHLLNDRGGLWRYADVRSYTSQAPSRLEVLASDRDPAISEAFNADDYRAVAQILEQFYSIAITDCGTGMLHSAMSAILDMADQIVLVSPVTVDGARSASATLDWLQAHGHQDLAVSAVVVLSAVKNPRRNAVNVTELQEHFTKRCRAVIGIPFDPHLEQGSEVDLDLLRTSTRDAYLEVGATIADHFNSGVAS
ncbi:AAA family ATPase [Nonomuraea sp. NPDC050404]|uniref:MinD/ParA family ATP-binding protein n=1 Tax=Nonomuraea sp. NPDC050404 TaxID=3155783 RepID=UPI0033E32E4C